MAYDADGRRTELVATSAAGVTTTTTFRYASGVLAEETEGPVTRQFVTDASGAISKMIVTGGDDAGTYLVSWNGHGDALNLLRVNGDGSTTLANSFTYDSWGTPTVTPHNGIGDLGFRYLYVGQYGVAWDDAFGLGLHHMGVRHYSPALGRFIQPDPAAAEANAYAYAGNNPTSRVDPTGEAFWFVALAGWVVRTAAPAVAARAIPWFTRLVTPTATTLTAQRSLQHINDRHGWPALEALTRSLPALANLFPNTSRFWPMTQAQWQSMISAGSRGAIVAQRSGVNWSWTGPTGWWHVTTRVTFTTSMGYDARRNVITNVVTFIWENGRLVTAYPGY